MAVDNVDENTRKHLEMIQGVISRMGSNSFATKTWAVGLIAATFALALESNASHWLVLIALMPALVFWLLDSYYLRQERLFRRLYDAVRTDEQSAKAAGPFSMSTKPYVGEPTMGFWRVARSVTIAGLYLPLAVLVVLAFTLVYLRRA